MGPVMPQMQQEEEEKMGLLDRLGKGIQTMRADPERMARLQMGFNSMRLNPDQGIAASAANTIKQAQERRQMTKTTNDTVAYLKRQTNNPMAQQAAAAIEANPSMVKEILGSFLTNQMKPTSSVSQQSGAQLNASANGGVYDPSAMFNVTSGPEGDKISRIGGGGVTVNTGDKQSPGLKAVNEAAAKDYIEWMQGGGSDATANLAQIGTVLQRLESGEQLTGPLIGAINSVGLLAFVNPEAENAKEQVQEVVQRNLRIVLGAQFAQKEGEQLISRAYNPTLPPAENTPRLRKLFQQMSTAGKQKEAMADYFEKNGYSMLGYRGPTPDIEDFYTALSQFEVNQIVNGFRYLGGDSTKESNWEKVN